MSSPSTFSQRTPEAEVDAGFVERWSRRALSNRPLTAAQIASLFEAARFAPSANNLQPWLFVYVTEGNGLAEARALLKETNQAWASRAPLLVFVFARRRHPETNLPLRTGAFDTGAAWFSLALQAHKLGLAARAMGGIHHDKVYAALGVPEADFESMVGVAIGYPDDAAVLPEAIREKEKPTTRKSTRSFVFAGRYESR